MNLVNPAAFTELVFVFCVLCYLLARYAGQRRSLSALAAHIAAESAALEGARVVVQQGRINKLSARDITSELARTSVNDSLVQGRLQLLLRYRLNGGEGDPARYETAALPFQSGTDDARFWAGAFVFIGLIGTLLCLGVAVFYLMSIVGRAGSSSGMESSLKDVTTNMTATFMSMGLAFINTGAGAGLTVLLSGQIARVERQADMLSNSLDEFVLIELGPLASGSAATLSHVQGLELLAARMETVSSQFVMVLEKTQANFEALSKTTAVSSDRLDTAATAFGAASNDLSENLTPLAERLSKVGQIVERHEGAQSAFISNVQPTLQWLETAVSNANTSFSNIDAFREELQQVSRSSTALHMEMLERLQQQGRDIGERGQRTFLEFKQEAIVALAAVEQRIQQGNERDEETVKALHGAIKTFAEYTAHVEDVLRQMPAALGTEPIISFQSNQADVLARLTDCLDSIQAEISGMRADLAKASSIPGSSLQADLKRVAANGDAFQVDLGNLAAQISGIGGQLTQVTTAVSSFQHSIIIPLGRRH